MISTTERLKIREAKLNDAQFFIELMNSPGWLEHIGDRNIRSIENAKNYIQGSLIKSYRDNGFGLYALEELRSGKLIGIAGLVKRDTLDLPDLGFAILPEAEGQGYAHEACRAILKKIDQELPLKKILAITSPGNIRSQKLLLRLGFEKFVNKKESDVDTYALLLKC